MYVEPRKMVQMNRFAGQKLRHRCREQTYGHEGGKSVGRWRWWCAELGDWDDMYTLMCITMMTNKNLKYKQTKNRLNFYMCFCIWSGIFPHIMYPLENPAVHLRDESKKGIYHLSITTEILLISGTSWKCLTISMGFWTTLPKLFMCRIKEA